MNEKCRSSCQKWNLDLGTALIIGNISGPKNIKWIIILKSDIECPLFSIYIWMIKGKVCSCREKVP
jgi:hypothetical protein